MRVLRDTCEIDPSMTDLNAERPRGPHYDEVGVILVGFFDDGGPRAVVSHFGSFRLGVKTRGRGAAGTVFGDGRAAFCSSLSS